ncbi:hypothetical protein MK805_14210 [Shimazuella sp. AN120528]|uniref:hypothetical protein n=1 Tax=Shimazuella soli TaxID=1892854 RepID=UPI001F0E5F57|nr:hypothetical protein [Shimazuella soli]MCH5586092.1 hypothetical protein [Shimazuella soli]
MLAGTISMIFFFAYAAVVHKLYQKALRDESIKDYFFCSVCRNIGVGAGMVAALLVLYVS